MIIHQWYSTILKPDRNRRRSKQSISLHSALYIDGTNTNKQADKHSMGKHDFKSNNIFFIAKYNLVATLNFPTYCCQSVADWNGNFMQWSLEWWYERREFFNHFLTTTFSIRFKFFEPFTKALTTSAVVGNLNAGRRWQLGHTLNSKVLIYT